MNIMYTDINSLMSIFDLFSAEVVSMNSDFIFITDCSLSGKITDSMVNLSHYTIFRIDREHRKGGGVCIYGTITQIW